MFAKGPEKGFHCDVLVEARNLDADSIPTDPFAKYSILILCAKRVSRASIVIVCNRNWTRLGPYTSITGDLNGRHEKDGGIESTAGEDGRCQRRGSTDDRRAEWRIAARDDRCCLRETGESRRSKRKEMSEVGEMMKSIIQNKHKNKHGIILKPHQGPTILHLELTISAG